MSFFYTTHIGIFYYSVYLKGNHILVLTFCNVLQLQNPHGRVCPDFNYEILLKGKTMKSTRFLGLLMFSFFLIFNTFDSSANASLEMRTKFSKVNNATDNEYNCDDIWAEILSNVKIGEKTKYQNIETFESENGVIELKREESTAEILNASNEKISSKIIITQFFPEAKTTEKIVDFSKAQFCDDSIDEKEFATSEQVVTYEEITVPAGKFNSSHIFETFTSAGLDYKLEPVKSGDSIEVWLKEISNLDSLMLKEITIKSGILNNQVGKFKSEVILLSITQ